MDAPDLDPRAHRAALTALSRVHLLSRTGRRLRATLDRVSARVPPPGPIRMIDVACGGGDAVLDAARWARRRGRRLELTAIDLSDVALAFGAARVRRAGLDGPGVSIAWVRGDALDALPAGPFDLAFSSLFLHHLTDDEVVSLLAGMRDRARHVRVEDLRRTRLGLALAWGTLRAVSRSRVAHVDGPRSVRAAWTRDELSELAAVAGLDACRIRRVWPQRLELEWEDR